MDVIPGRLSFVLGDISQAKTRAVVNAANTELWMGSGVAGAIKARGGSVIEREAMAQAPIRAGGCVLTTGGNLYADYVIHVATMAPGGVAEERYVRNGTLTALSLAMDNNIETISFPALGTGVGGLGIESCARTMLPVIANWLKEHYIPEAVEIVLFDEHSLRVFIEVWNDLKLQGEL